jgi:integrase
VTNKLAQALAKRDDGVLFDDEGQSLGEYIEWWLTTSKRGRVKATTYESYAREVRKHIIPGLGRIRLRSLSPAHLQSYYSSKCDSGLAPRTVHYHHTLLNQALKKAVKWGYVRRNVAAVVDPPKVEKKEMNPLSAAQVKVLLEAAKGDRLEAFYLLAVSTGMRLGELQALKWADIDLSERTLSVNRTLSATKGGPVFGPPKTSRSRRKIFLSLKSVEALRRHRERQATEKEVLGDRWHDDDLVFCSVVGTPLSRHNLGSRSFKPLLRRANLPNIRFHELRHTCATLLLSKNVHPKLVQELLGHASISTTLDTYSHVLCGMSRVVADTMDNILP